MQESLIYFAKIAWCIYMVLWVTIRFKPNRNSRKMSISFKDRSIKERFSMAISFTGLGIIPAIWAFTDWLNGYNHQTNLIIIAIGIAMLIGALILFRKTHKALGKMWSHSLDLRDGHKLVTKGIYEKVRHPMYSAFWLWAVALPFVINNWIAGFSGIVGFGTLYFLRVDQEEKMMENEFGEEYREYSKNTKRIIPGIY